MREERHERLNGGLYLGETIGRLGISDKDLSLILQKETNLQFLNEEEQFVRFIEGNYKLFKWDTCDLNEKDKKALFARMFVNLSRYIYIGRNGCEIDNKTIFNGTLYSPRKVIDNEIIVLKSNYFSRMAFMKNECTINSKLLNRYKCSLKMFDSETGRELERFSTGSKRCNCHLNQLLSSLAITSHTVSVLIETNNGYLYTLREIGFNENATLITGIVDRKNLTELIKVELMEELGIDKGVETVLSEGVALVSQNSNAGSIAVINFMFLVKVDLTFEEINKSFETAIDRYENSNICKASVNRNDLIDYFEDIDNKSIVLKAFLSAN